MKKQKKKQWVYWLLCFAALMIFWIGFRIYGHRIGGNQGADHSLGNQESISGEEQFSLGDTSGGEFSLDDVPAYAGEPFCIINENQPYFDTEELPTEAFESYGELDALGRCTAGYANIGKELMPTQERQEIGMIKPSGWQYSKYDFIEKRYLYNRCHLLGFQLTGENANERNLITGTRYMNVEGMLPFENQVANYVRRTGNHVLYRVTPVFEGENLLATGVRMEAWSVEDAGEGICFHVFCYNVQPGVVIDYATGANEAE